MLADVISDAVKEELYRVHRALNILCRENPIWESNLNVFLRMDHTQRHRWWERAKRQAELGAPAMKTLVLKVIQLRLTT